MAALTDIHDDVRIAGRSYHLTIPVKSVDCSLLPRVVIDYGTPMLDPANRDYDSEWMQASDKLIEGVRNNGG